MNNEITGIRRILDPAVALFVGAFTKGLHADVDIVVDDVAKGIVVIASYERPWSGGGELLTIDDVSLDILKTAGDFNWQLMAGTGKMWYSTTNECLAVSDS